MRQLFRTCRARAFTLIELMVAITIILVLMALLLSGIARAVGRAREVGGQRAVETLTLGITQFENEFGFAPPLVHDGAVMTMGDPTRRPAASTEDGPVVEMNAGQLTWEQLVVWLEGSRADSDILRRRTGVGADGVELIGGGVWDDDGAWDDIRYSKYALPYYLGGVGGKRLDGVAGPGMARPQADGLFVGVGYPVGSTRDRYPPMVDADKGSLKTAIGYFEPEEYPEHGQAAPASPMPTDSEVAYIDPWGRALRYYRWEPGRLSGGRLVVENTLDLNIPPVLLNPEVYGAVRNDPSTARDIDLTSGNAELKAARYAVVSAGPDGLFGTEPTDELARRLRRPTPTTLEEKMALRKLAWENNIVGLGK